MKGRSAFMLLALTGLLQAPSAEGQTLRETFERLYIFGDCGEPVCLDVSASVHGRHFSALAEQAGTDMIGFVVQSIGSSLSSVPIPSSNSGSLFRFEDGALVSTPSSAGPVFMERSQTLGQGNLMMGLNVARIAPSNLRGEPLDDLELVFTHEDVGTAGLGDPDFENDVIRVTTDLDLTLTVASLFLTYGVTPSVDLGVALPVVSASLGGSSVAVIEPFGGGSSTPHRFLVDGTESLTSTSSVDQSATGIGDMALRLKANLVQRESMGFAALGELRVPTGDEENFHGTGETAARLMGIFSARSGAVSPHLNAGFTLRTGDLMTNSVSFLGGFDVLLSEATTASIEVIGDFLIGEVENDEAVTRVETYQFPVSRTVEVSRIPERTDHVFDAVAGLKLEPTEGFRVVGSVLVPLYEGGVRPDVQWTIGLEKVF